LSLNSENIKAIPITAATTVYNIEGVVETLHHLAAVVETFHLLIVAIEGTRNIVLHDIVPTIDEVCS